jgi:ribosomal protein S18 acetylase RimI-like enzyme
MDIRRFTWDELEPFLPSLKELFADAFFNGHMYDSLLADIARKPDPFAVFLAYDQDDIVGCVVLEQRVHDGVDYHDLFPVHLQRFAVAPSHRSQGIGKQLLDTAKTYAFQELGLDALFCKSNEAGAMSFYGREGALFKRSSIEEYSHRNTPEENLVFFREFLTQPIFRTYRYPAGHGILFVFSSDEKTPFFEQRGYYTKEKLFALTPLLTHRFF